MRDDRSFVGPQPSRALLREQLTRHVEDLGGAPETVDVMVRRADFDDVWKVAWRIEAKKGLAYCMEGALRLECVSESDIHRHRVLAFVAPEEFVPCPASPYRRGYRLRLCPHESATIATWSPAALRQIMLTVPDEGMPSFLATTHLGWTPLRERWAMLSMLDARERIPVVLADLAARFGVPDGDGVRIVVPLLDRHIAALIGTARERVNRCINALIPQGLLRRLPDRQLWVSRELLAAA